jgi:hypothetical protein
MTEKYKNDAYYRCHINSACELFSEARKALPSEALKLCEKAVHVLIGVNEDGYDNRFDAEKNPAIADFNEICLNGKE